MCCQKAMILKTNEQVLHSWDGLNKKIGIVLSGDPNRKQFFEQMKLLYNSHGFVNRISLLFERNPAVSFNMAAKIGTADILFCAADVYVSLGTVKSRANSILCGDADAIPIVPPRYKINNNIQFCSGAFTVDRLKLLCYPIPEKPDFLEEKLWQNSTLETLKFKAYLARAW